MATSTSFTTILDQLLDNIPGLGWKFTSASITTTTVTTNNPEVMKLGTEAPSERYTGLFIYVPSAAAADMVRAVENLSVAAVGASNVATITHSGPHTATGTTVTCYLLGLHPDTLRNLANDALEDLYLECAIPLGHGPADWHMQGSGVTDWTATNSTRTKQTTSSEVWMGARSLSVTNSSANGKVRSAALNMGHGESGTMFGIGRPDTSGTATLRVVDQDGNTVEDVDFTQEDWTFVRRRFTLGSTDEGILLDLIGSGASEQIEWQAAWVTKDGNNVFRLPSYLDERFKIKGVAVARFHRMGNEEDTYLADAVTFDLLREGIDFSFINRMADANPHMILIHAGYESLLQQPLFLVFSSPYSAPYGVAVTISADSDTSVCPAQVWLAKCEYLLGERYADSFPGLQARAENDLNQRLRARAPALLPRPQWHGPTGGRRV